MKLANYKSSLLNRLKDPEYAAEYLAQVLDSGDRPAFFLALRDVVEARGGVSVIARQARVQRQGLYKALSGDGNPRLTTLQGILKLLGLRISVTRELKAA